MDVDYSTVSADHHEKLANSANPVTRYYHKNRYQKIRNFLSKMRPKATRILDIGCGCSNWNKEKTPVVGLDSNKDALDYGKKAGYLEQGICWDLGKLPLPFEKESFDCIIMSEVFEHLQDPAPVLGECRRMLKEGGTLIATVPLDTFLSPWQILFESKCFVVGNILGDDYYKNRCGHVQHFSVDSLSALLEENGLSVAEKNISIMNIGIVAEKRQKAI